MTDTSSNGPANDHDTGETYASAAPDSEPIEAEFRPAEPEAHTRPAGGPGWTGAMALAVLATLGGAVGGTFGARLLAAPSPSLGESDIVTPETIDRLRAELDTELSEQSTETASLATRLDASTTQLAALQASLSAQGETLARLEATPRPDADRLATLDNRLRALESASSSTGAGAGTAPADMALGALASRIEALEGAATRRADRLDALAATLADTDLAGLESRVAELEAERRARQQAAAAAPADAPLQTDLAIALADIALAATAGDGFAGPHARLAAALPGDPHVEALAPLAASGVPTPDQLARDFQALVPAARAADPTASEGGLGLAERLFGDQFEVRRDGEVSVDDTLASATVALERGDVTTAVETLANLPEAVRSVLDPWARRARERLALDRALDGLRSRLASPAGEQGPPATGEPRP